MSNNIETVRTADYNAVIAAADKYVEGLRVGSLDIATEAFHKDATMYGFINPPKLDMLAGPTGNIWAFIKKEGSTPNINTRNDVLAITQTTAVVRDDMEGDAAGTNYTDSLTIIKIEGKWQVIAKVFHKYD